MNELEKLRSELEQMRKRAELAEACFKEACRFVVLPPEKGGNDDFPVARYFKNFKEDFKNKL